MTKLYLAGGNEVVDMPPATTGKYAAMRVAEHLGYDPEEHAFELRLWPNGPVIHEDEIVEGYDQQRVVLVA